MNFIDNFIFRGFSKIFLLASHFPSSPTFRCRDLKRRRTIINTIPSRYPRNTRILESEKAENPVRLSSSMTRGVERHPWHATLIIGQQRRLCSFVPFPTTKPESDGEHYSSRFQHIISINLWSTTTFENLRQLRLLSNLHDNQAGLSRKRQARSKYNSRLSIKTLVVDSRLKFFSLILDFLRSWVRLVSFTFHPNEVRLLNPNFFPRVVAFPRLLETWKIQRVMDTRGRVEEESGVNEFPSRDAFDHCIFLYRFPIFEWSRASQRHALSFFLPPYYIFETMDQLLFLDPVRNFATAFFFFPNSCSPLTFVPKFRPAIVPPPSVSESIPRGLI